MPKLLFEPSQGPTRPFIKPIIISHVDIIASVFLMPQFSFNEDLFGVLDDAPSSSVTSWHSSVLALLCLDGHHLRVTTSSIIIWGSKPILFVVLLWNSPLLKLVIILDDFLRDTISPWIVSLSLSLNLNILDDDPNFGLHANEPVGNNMLQNEYGNYALPMNYPTYGSILGLHVLQHKHDKTIV